MKINKEQFKMTRRGFKDILSLVPVFFFLGGAILSPIEVHIKLFLVGAIALFAWYFIKE